jgi:hypothetical protein
MNDTAKNTLVLDACSTDGRCARCAYVTFASPALCTLSNALHAYMWQADDRFATSLERLLHSKLPLSARPNRPPQAGPAACVVRAAGAVPEEPE